VAEARVDFEAVLADYQAKAEEMHSRSASRLEGLQAQAEAGREQVEGMIAEHEASRMALVEAAKREAGELEESVHGVGQRRLELQREVAALNGQVEATEELVDNATRSIEQIRSGVEELMGRAEATKRTMEENFERAGKAVFEVNAACGRTETLHRSISAGLVEIGGAYEKVNALREQALQCEQAGARLATSRAEGERVLEKLEEVVGSAGEMRDTLFAAATSADGKIGQLDSHHAAARHVLRELSETNVKGHGLIEKANATLQVVRHAERSANESMDGLLKDAKQLTAKADESTGRLADERARVEAVLNDINSMTAPAREMVEQLGRHLEEGRSLEEGMAEWRGEAGKLFEMISSADRVLGDARATDASLSKTADSAREVHTQLVGLADRADRQSDTLRELNTTAGSLADRHSQLNVTSQEATESLAEQVESARAAAEASERLLTEFSQQVHELASHLTELRVKASQLEETVGDATARPTQIIATAQAQAAQLERVCGIVRKVQTGLAGATLKAKKEADRCHLAGTEAADRLTRLTSETEQASRTLNEWTEEAVRVQSRLERTLQQAPSIRETHPAEPLLSRSRAPGRGSRLAEVGTGGELQMLTDRGRAPGHREQSVPEPASRAEEVSRMIEDAKRAASVNP
jgi:chromosome segregation ATPase